MVRYDGRERAAALRPHSVGAAATWAEQRTGRTRTCPSAVARYQAENDLVPNGRVDFDLYYRLLASNSRQPGRASGARPRWLGRRHPCRRDHGGSRGLAGGGEGAGSQPWRRPDSPWRPRAGRHPSYHAGETITLNLQPTQDAYTYCYYQDAAGMVSRIFPNRFQPDALIPARRQIQVPPASGAFAIRFDKPRTREAFLCVAADRELGMKLPNKLKAQDLARLPVHEAG